MTTPEPENSGNQTEANAGLPSLQEFQQLPLDKQEELLRQAEVQEEQNSENIPEEQDSKEEQPAEEDKKETPEPEPQKTDKQEAPELEALKKEIESLKKSNKELQAEFTRRSQKLAEYEKGKASERTENLEKGSEEISELAQLAGGDKDTEKFLRKLDEVVSKRAEKIAQRIVEEKIKPVEEQVFERTASENLARFNKDVDDFLKSPLSELSESLNQIIAERYSSNEEMLEAAKHNPNLFTEFRKELKDRYTDKVVELLHKSKSNTAPVKNPQERSKEVKQTGVTGKSNTFKPASSGLDDINNFKKASPEEQEAYLRSKGMWE